MMIGNVCATGRRERREERRRVCEEIEGLAKRLPELKVEYGQLLRRDEVLDAADVHGQAVEVFDRIQELERRQFFDSLDMIGRCSTARAMDVVEGLLSTVLRPAVGGGGAYESTSADGSTCVVVHEGVVRVRR